MKTNQISLKNYCSQFSIDFNFIEELEEFGLIQTEKEEEDKFLVIEQLPLLERYSRMFYELNINTPGIDAIQNLLTKMEQLQNEIFSLKERLLLFEDLE